MAHYAKVVNGIVQNVITADQEFISKLPSHEVWIQTSYNTRGGIHYNSETGLPSEDQTKALRKNFAGVGFKYDTEVDVFYDPKSPFPSWSLNTTSYTWEAPVPLPDDGGSYLWDEVNKNWVAAPQVEE